MDYEKVYCCRGAFRRNCAGFGSDMDGPDAYAVKSEIISTDTTFRRTSTYSVDSVKGTDTLILYKYKSIDPTATYALATTESIGAIDTLQVMVWAYDYNKVQMGAVALADTLTPLTATSNVYRTSDLPINKTLKGNYVTIGVVGWISSKVAYIRRAYLIKTTSVTGYVPEFYKP